MRQTRPFRCEGYSVAKAGSLSRSFALLVVIFAMVNSSFECAVVPRTATVDVNDSFVLRIRGAVDLAQSQSQQLRGRGTWFKARPISRGIALRLTSAAPRVRATCARAHKRDRVKEKEREKVCMCESECAIRLLEKSPMLSLFLYHSSSSLHYYFPSFFIIIANLMFKRHVALKAHARI